MKSSFPVKQNKVEEARAILQRIYPDDEVEMEMKALASSVEAVVTIQVTILRLTLLSSESIRIKIIKYEILGIIHR